MAIKKGIFINFLKFLFFLSLGIGMLWLVYKDQQIEPLKEAIEKADFFWMWVSLFLGLLSHISRAARWNIVIKTLGHQVRPINSFFMVMIGYLANLALPRMGEVSRCALMSKYEKISFPSVLGTVVLERIIDVFMLLGLLLLVIATQFGQANQLLEAHPQIAENIHNLISNPILYIATGLFVGAAIVFFYFFRKKIQHLTIYQKVKSILISFGEGMKTIRRMKHPFWFVFHTFFIWVMYFLMFYLGFQCFDFTKDLPLLPGLAIFVIASFGMVAPVSGGIGPWHFLVIEMLYIYGIERDPDGRAFAFLSHSAMTLMLIVIGFISFILVPIVNKNYKKNAPEQKKTV